MYNMHPDNRIVLVRISQDPDQSSYNPDPAQFRLLSQLVTFAQENVEYCVIQILTVMCTLEIKTWQCKARRGKFQRK